MKRLFAIVLSLMVAVSFGFTWTGQASATEKGTQEISKPVQQSTSEYKEHEALVMFKTSSKLSSKDAQSSLKSGENGVSDIKVVKNWDFAEASGDVQSDGPDNLKAGKGAYTNVCLVRSSSLTTEQLIKKLRKQKDVLYAEPNYKIHALSVNDPYYPYQWSMQNSNVEYEWDDNETTGTDAIVAVVDTGVDYTHEELSRSMWENKHYPTLHGECGWDFSATDDDPMDENGHGTHCAGIIGAAGNNGVGISGVNQNVKIMALRILDADGSGWNSEEIGAYNYISKALDLGEPVRAINNSWGGGDDSEIFAKLIDIVGEKGAISVFAAGNEGSDNDKNKEYPSDIDSDYSVVVAATKQDNTLVSFSNYGKETVDVAAPGTDILSSVSYECYNPSIYTADEQGVISREYNGYEDATIEESGNAWGIPNEEDIVLPEGATYSADITNDGVNGSKSLRMSFKGMKSGSYAFITFPYTLDNSSMDEEGQAMVEAGQEPHYSIMAKPVIQKDDGWSFMVTMDAPADAVVDENNVEDYYLYGYYLSKDQDFWDHYDMPCLLDEDTDDNDLYHVATDRKVVMALYANSTGDYDLIIDDMGVSYENMDASMLKKYDFMSGTSMATPFITGSVALKAAELEKKGTAYDPITVISNIATMAKESPAIEKVISGGAFDFSVQPGGLPPRIGKVQIMSMAKGTTKGTIKISGSGLDPAEELEVAVSYAGADDFVPATIKSKSEKEVVIEDNGWINNLIDVKVTGYAGKSVTKKNIYLVKGKKAFSKGPDVGESNDGSKVITDGKKIYKASSLSDTILTLSPTAMGNGFDYTVTLDADKLFKTKKSSTANYDMLFSRDLASINGKLYTVVEYGQAVEEASDDDFWIIFSKTGKAVRPMDIGDYDDIDTFAGNGVLYSSELKLVVANPATGGYASLGSLPENLAKTQDWTMASYNGKLYFIGGYRTDLKKLTTTVYIYNPATKRWSVGKALPEGRAGGQAIQTGNKLVYTLGYGAGQKGVSEEEQTCPKNLVYTVSNGKGSWTKKGETLYPFDASNVVKRGANKYVVFDGNIGLCKDGIVYIGTPVEDYGDTFTFNATTGKFADTGYNYSAEPENADVSATTWNKKICAFEEYGVNTAPITSGLIYIKHTKKKHGKVTGANRYYIPGDKATIVVKANKNYRISLFKYGTKSIKLQKKQTKRTYKTPFLTQSGKTIVVKTKFTKIKKSKKKKN